MTTAPDPMAGQDAPQRVSFYFSAHQDDWQLFMNPSAFRDVADSQTKCVFIHMTAGDAGRGTGKDGRKHPFYLARENGAESAIRFMADLNGRAPVEQLVAPVACNGHPIRRVNYRNTVAYFLRLPDGSPAGTGYADTGYRSLMRLASGQIDTLSAIDSTTSYRGWSDLVATLRSIIDIERGHAPAVRLHVPEPDPVINPNDHADHFMTAKAALDAAEGLAGARRVHHVGYASADRPENLSSQDRDIKCAVYAVTLAGVLALDHANPWQQDDQKFVGRNYCRVEAD
jgi:GlcNAc-PI de-N-acetylase